MAIDGPSGVHDDDPEQGGDSQPAKGREHGGQDADRPAGTQLAEVRGRAEYYEAVRATDQRMAAAGGAELASGMARTRSAWDVEAVGHPDRPPPDSLQVAPERTRHILDGDRWGGGHRHGTGRPGKTEFPSGWDDAKIIGHVLNLAMTHAPVTSGERNELRTLAEAMDLPTDQLAGLNVQG